MEPSFLPERRVPWWTGLTVFILLVLLLVLFSLVLRILMMSFDPESVLGVISSPFGLMIQVMVMSVLFAGSAFVVPSIWRVPPHEWLHLSPVRPAALGLAVLGVVGLGFLVDESVYLLYRTNPEFFNPAGLDLFNQMFTAATPGVFVLLTIVVTLGPGIGEELFFRGLMMRSLLSTGRPTAAVVLSAVLFGLIHFDVLQSPGAAIIGVYLGLVALRTRSIYPAMAAHGVNNLVCALFARFADADGPNPVLEGHPPWLLLTATAVFSVSLLLLFRVTRVSKTSPSPIDESARTRTPFENM